MNLKEHGVRYWLIPLIDRFALILVYSIYNPSNMFRKSRFVPLLRWATECWDIFDGVLSLYHLTLTVMRDNVVRYSRAHLRKMLVERKLTKCALVNKGPRDRPLTPSFVCLWHIYNGAIKKTGDRNGKSIILLRYIVQHVLSFFRLSRIFGTTEQYSANIRRIFA